jgi:hypothetical protein
MTPAQSSSDGIGTNLLMIVDLIAGSSLRLLEGGLNGTGLSHGNARPAPRVRPSLILQETR